MVYCDINVYDVSDYVDLIDNYSCNGFTIISKNDNICIIKKNYYGDFKVHILIAFLTIWWSFLFFNLIYLIYSYFFSYKIYRINYNSSYVNKQFSYKFNDYMEIIDYIEKNSSKNENKEIYSIINYLEDD